MSDQYWNDKFNALPEDVRTIGSAMEIQTRIQHLNFEKMRLKKRYAQSMLEINVHIKGCKKWLKELKEKDNE